MASMNDLVAQNSGTMPDRVAAMGTTTATNMDLVNQLVQMQTQQADLLKQRAELPSAAQSAASAPSLAGLALGGIGLATGNQGLAEGGLGLSQGFVQGQQAKVAQQAQSLDAQYDETQKMLEANRQRLATMLQSRPEMFLDPMTGKSVVDPRLLGYSATGFVIPVDPGSAYALQKQTKSQQLGVEMGVALMLNGDTPDKRLQGGLMVNNALGLGLQPEFFEALEGQDETSQWISLLGQNNVDTASVIRAQLYARQNRKNLADPAVVGMLRPSKATGGTSTIPEKQLALLAEMNIIIEKAGGAMSTASLEEQIDFAFGEGRSGDNALLKRQMLGDDAFGSGVSGETLAQIMGSVTSGLMTLAAYSPQGFNSPFFKSLGVTDEKSMMQRVGPMAESLVQYNREAVNAATNQHIGFKTRQLTDAMVANGMDFGDAASTAALLMLQVRQDPTVVNAVGRVDMKALDEKFSQLLLEVTGGNTD